MIKIGIIGGAGYTAGELIRLLLNHPQAELLLVHSQSQAGKPLYQTHEGIYGETEMCFTDSLNLIDRIDLLFLCMGHGESRKWMNENGPSLSKDLKIIDLANDFRLNADAGEFVYGLTELNKDQIKQGRHIANPGCFATCIQLALIPLAQAKLLHSDIHIHAITGSTGAGQKPTETSHFSWRNNNLSIYKPFTHQHLPEIRESLVQLQPEFDQKLHFIPVRGDFARGIFATLYMESSESIETIEQLFYNYYQSEPFVHISRKTVDMKQVVNTNKALIQIEKHDNQLLITSTIDNLLKGASGQAVENMNLLFGLDQKMGLMLKSSAF